MRRTPTPPPHMAAREPPNDIRHLQRRTIRSAATTPMQIVWDSHRLPNPKKGNNTAERVRPWPPGDFMTRRPAAAVPAHQRMVR